MIAVFIWLQFVKECFPAMYIQVTDNLSAPDTTFLQSRKMMTWNIIKFKHGIKSMLKMRLSPHCFYEDKFVSLSNGSCLMVCRCLHHTFQQQALIPPVIQVGCCLQMRGNGRVHAASLGDQVLPVLGSGLSV